MNAIDLSIVSDGCSSRGSANTVRLDRWPARVRSSTDPSVRVATTEAEIDAIFRLRYKLYVTRDGKAYAHADHARRRMIDPVDDVSLNFCAIDEDRMVAAVRLTRAEDALADAQTAMLVKASGIKRLGRVLVCSRFVAEPCAPARRAIVPLFQQVHRAGLNAGGSISLLATRPRLAGIFAKFGWRFAGLSFNDPVAGLMHILSIDLYDLDHLADIESPLLSVLMERFRQYGKGGDAS